MGGAPDILAPPGPAGPIRAHAEAHRLSEPERARYRRDGFLVRERVFDDAELARLSAALDRLQGLAAGVASTSDITGARFVMDETGPEGAPRIQRVVWAGAAAPELFEPTLDPRVLTPVLDLLGEDQVDQLVHQVHFKHPGDGVRFGLHQDAWNRRHGTALWRGRHPDGDYVQVVLAVDPMSADTGPLRVVAGSHQGGPILGLDREARARRRAARRPLQPVVVPAGSLILFGPFLLHASDENRGRVARRVLVSGFCRRGVNRRPYPGAGLGVRRSRRP